MNPRRQTRAVKTGVTLLAGLLLCGCASTPDPELQYRRDTALARWKACVDRHANTASEPVASSLNTMEHACEGHRRDVLLTYPPHLEEQLDTLLKTRARERLASGMTATIVVPAVRKLD